MRCCGPCLGGQAAPSSLTFANSPGSAVGDASIPRERRLYLGIIFPEATAERPLHMFFSQSDEGSKLLQAACAAVNLKLDKGRLVGSPDRLNLFTLNGDLLRTDLDLEAHMGSTLHPSSWVVLEKGNRLGDARLAAIRQARDAVNGGGGGGCALM